MTFSCIVIFLLAGSIYAEQFQESKRNESVTDRQVFSKNPLAENGNFWYSHIPSLPIVFAESPLLPDGPCRKQTERYLRELRNGTLWAVKMYDASVKYPDGIISGGRRRFGNFDECYYLHANIPSKEKGADTEDIRGRYCQVEFYFRKEDKPPTNSRPYTNYFDLNDSVWEFLRDNGDFRRGEAGHMKLALCVPSACTAKDVETSLKKPLEELASMMKIKLRVAVPSYYSITVKEAPRFSTGAMCYCAIVLSLVGLVIVATWRDILSSTKNSSRASFEPNWLLCFSARRNLRNILNTSHSNLSLDALDTLRDLFAIVLISMHASARWGVHFKSYPDLEKIMHPRLLLCCHLVAQSADGYLTIAGLLQAYNTLKDEYAGKNSKFVPALIARYWRLTPAYMAVILFFIYVFPILGSGPLWKKMIEEEYYNCAKYWWANLLYVHNYVNTENYCMLHSWSMSVQFHAWILTFFLMKILKRLPERLRYSFLALPVLASVYLRINEIYGKPWLMLAIARAENMRECPGFLSEYIKTHTRLGPHFVGVIAGVILYDCEHYGWKLSKAWSRTLFTILGAIPVLLVIWMLQFADPNVPQGNLHLALFVTSHGFLFSLSVSGTIILLTVGQGLDTVRSCLTPRWTQPLAKLTYAAYIGHIIVPLYAVAVGKNFGEPTVFNVFPYQLLDLFCSLWIALFIVLVFEMPAINIRNVLWRNRRENAKKNETLNRIKDE